MTPSPHGEGWGYLSFSLGEKVAEERGRMRGLLIHEMLAKKTRIYGPAMQTHAYFALVCGFPSPRNNHAVKVIEVRAEE